MTGAVSLLVMIALLAGARILRSRRTLARLEHLIRDARALASNDITFEPVTPPWHAALDGLDVPSGMTALGDFIEVPAGRPASGALRAFTDADRTTYGWLAKAGPRRILVMAIASSTDTEVYLTRLSPAGSTGHLAAPPWARREDVPYLLGIDAAIARHRERVASAKGLRTVTTLPELQAELLRVRQMTAAWRAAQAPRTLLEMDLRSILGPRYATLGPTLASRLGVELPQARVVS